MSVEWRNIPGYDGFYQINDEGDVRSWRYKSGRSRKPRMLVPFMRKRGEDGHARYVKLTDAQGGAKDVKVLTLMVDIWLGGCPAGMVPYHKNGDLNDNYVGNIAFTTPRALGKQTGAQSKRKAVFKIAPDGEVVKMYHSAREAARKNHMSYQTVLDRCNGKVKCPFALDGHDYRFADEFEGRTET